MKLGARLGRALNELATIVHPDTLRRWIRGAAKGKTNQSTARKGRPRTKIEIRHLIVTLACENNWGYIRIMGELKKLGITPPPDVVSVSQIACRERLGGVLKHYYRKTA